MKKEPHFQEGHLNIYVLDQDSVITSYGKHDRVIAFCAKHGEAYARLDLRHGLGIPTDKDIIRVGRTQGWRGRWRVVSRELWDDGQHYDVQLAKV